MNRAIFMFPGKQGSGRKIDRRAQRPVFENLEGRLVLTGGPAPTLGGSLSMIGVIPGQPPVVQNPSVAVQNDLKKLGADLLAVQGKSGVTVSELTTLKATDETIAKAGIQLDGKALMTAQLEMVQATQSGKGMQKAHDDFAKLFGTKLSPDQINRIFGLEIQIVKDSHASQAQLKAIADDQAQLQKDLPANPPPPPTNTPPAPTGKLADDLKKLGQDSLAIQFNSGVTVAELTALQGADNELAKNGIKLDGKALLTVQIDMANAVAGNLDTKKAHDNFAKLFGGKLSAQQVDQLFGLEMQIVKDSHATPAQIKLILDDQAQVQKDTPPPASGTTTPPPPAPSLGGSLSFIGVIPLGPLAPPAPPKS